MANIIVKEKENGIEVSIGLRLRIKASTTDQLKRMQPPPTAVRIGLRKFWTEFEKELGASGHTVTASVPVQKPYSPPKVPRPAVSPAGGNPDVPEINGYAAELLYANLAKLEARSVMVFIDACFSGESPRGPLFKKASGIRVRPKGKPTVPFTIISSARDDQIASWDQEAKHGLFTRHLLDALYGAADDERYGNADNRITLGEIRAYLDREMTYAARRHYGREQQAMVSGDPDKVIVNLKK